MRYYVALIHKEDDSDFGVSFPDLPGCVSAGLTLSEASTMGAEALSFHIELMIDEGEAIPEPSSLDEIMANLENRDGVPIMIPAAIKQPTHAVRANILLPDNLLSQNRCLCREIGHEPLWLSCLGSAKTNGGSMTDDTGAERALPIACRISDISAIAPGA